MQVLIHKFEHTEKKTYNMIGKNIPHDLHYNLYQMTSYLCTGNDRSDASLLVKRNHFLITCQFCFLKNNFNYFH